MSGVSARDALRQEVITLVSEIAAGSFGGDRFDASADFAETGMSSIEYLELIEKIETKFGVFIDLEHNGSLTSVDKFLDLLLQQGVSA